MVLATGCNAVALASARLTPAVSASSRITTSRPATTEISIPFQLPLATVVAQCPSAATLSKSFSPSVTNSVALGYFTNSGQR